MRSAGALTIVEKKAKGKEKQRAEDKGDKIWDLPKSKEVMRLEGIVNALREVQGGGKGPMVDTPPCFCQGESECPLDASQRLGGSVKLFLGLLNAGP